MPYVFSTTTADQEYCGYAKRDSKQVPVINKRILIKGQNNVVNKKTLLTTKGAVTEVSKEDLEFLNGHVAFKRHKDRGFMSVSDKKGDPEKVAADMSKKDKSAQLTNDDFEKPPEVGKKK